MSESTKARQATESEYLARQAADARAAMGKVWGEIRHNLASTVDPRQWAKAHPWATSGSALVAGFLAALGTIPSKEEQAIRRLARLQRDLSPPPPASWTTADAHAQRSGGQQAAAGQPGKPSFIAHMAQEAMHALPPVLAGILSNALHPEKLRAAAQQTQPSNPQQASPAEDVYPPGSEI